MIEGYYTELVVQESSIITPYQHRPHWKISMQYRLPGRLKVDVAKNITVPTYVNKGNRRQKRASKGETI